ncbi:MAG: 50S ribosomal protein L30e [Candidatus Hadarchaeales archaeon]
MRSSSELKELVASGKVSVGARMTLKSLKRGEVSLVLVSSNCSEDVVEDIRSHAKMAGVPVETFNGDSQQLGLACGKPFAVSVVALLSAPGGSERG